MNSGKFTGRIGNKSGRFDISLMRIEIPRTRGLNKIGSGLENESVKVVQMCFVKSESNSIEKISIGNQ